MATVCRQEIKDRLIAIGKWADVVRTRDDLKAEGMASVLAMREACRRVAPGETDDIWAKVRHRGRPTNAERAARLAAESQTDGGSPAVARTALADVKREARDARLTKRPVAKAAKPSEADGATERGLDVGVFANKSCSILASFMWAYPMVGVDGIRPEDAPSALAWQLLCDMKTSLSVRVDLMRSCLAPAMRRAGEEEDGGNRFDGEGEYDINAAIVAAADGRGGAA